MLTAFDRFCISHVCADNCKDSPRRCPLTDLEEAEQALAAEGPDYT